VRLEYARADVFSLACRQLENGDRDGMPNVILEAMASGLPIVSTTLDGISEAVVEGRCGFLVPQDDPAALSDALARVLEDGDLRGQLAEGARAHVVSRFAPSLHLP